MYLELETKYADMPRVQNAALAQSTMVFTLHLAGSQPRSLFFLFSNKVQLRYWPKETQDLGLCLVCIATAYVCDSMAMPQPKKKKKKSSFLLGKWLPSFLPVHMSSNPVGSAESLRAGSEWHKEVAGR